MEGGSCTAYDYVCGDPVNNLDLDGTHCQKTKTVIDDETGKRVQRSHKGHYNSIGCRAARIADEAGEGLADAGRATARGVARGTRVATRVTRCFAGAVVGFAPHPFPAGVAIASTGVSAMTYTAGGTIAAGGAAAVAAGGLLVVAGVGLAAYGGYQLYRTCR